MLTYFVCGKFGVVHILLRLMSSCACICVYCK